MKRNKNKIRYGKAERRLKIVAVTVSLLFAVLMLYPMIFAVSSSMKTIPKSTKYRRSSFPQGRTVCLWFWITQGRSSRTRKQ